MVLGVSLLCSTREGRRGAQSLKQSSLRCGTRLVGTAAPLPLTVTSLRVGGTGRRLRLLEGCCCGVFLLVRV
ncbi:hypothetical protein DXC46_00545 [Eggerthella lenta]|nr:hypothetical protein DXC46_00545 [Eggerthella lenta]